MEEEEEEEDSWWGGQHSLCLKQKSDGLSTLAGCSCIKITSAATRTVWNTSYPQQWNRSAVLESYIRLLPPLIHLTCTLRVYSHHHSSPCFKLDMKQLSLCGCDTANQRSSSFVGTESKARIRHVMIAQLKDLISWSSLSYWLDRTHFNMDSYF